MRELIDYFFPSRWTRSKLCSVVGILSVNRRTGRKTGFLRHSSRRGRDVSWSEMWIKCLSASCVPVKSETAGPGTERSRPHVDFTVLVIDWVIERDAVCRALSKPAAVVTAAVVVVIVVVVVVVHVPRKARNYPSVIFRCACLPHHLTLASARGCFTYYRPNKSFISLAFWYTSLARQKDSTHDNLINRRRVREGTSTQMKEAKLFENRISFI